MVDFAAVTDPRNPFNTDGLSREVLALIQYVIDGSRSMPLRSFWNRVAIEDPSSSMVFWRTDATSSASRSSASVEKPLDDWLRSRTRRSMRRSTSV